MNQRQNIPGKDKTERVYNMRRAVLLDLALEDHAKDAAIKPLVKKKKKCESRRDLLRSQLQETRLELADINGKLAEKLDKHLPSKYQKKEDK